MKESQSPYCGTLTIGAMVSGDAHGRGDRETYSEKARVALAVAKRAAGAPSFRPPVPKKAKNTKVSFGLFLKTLRNLVVFKVFF